jgi:hypothetical protein
MWQHYLARQPGSIVDSSTSPAREDSLNMNNFIYAHGTRLTSQTKKIPKENSSSSPDQLTGPQPENCVIT